jgi:hypothetical protein
MKTTLFILLILLTGCSKDNSGDPTFTLPPETQIGANTFGVTINGKVYVPRDPIGFNIGGDTPKGIELLGSSTANWLDLKIVDGASSVGFKMIIHFKDLNVFGVGKHPLSNSNFYGNVDSIDADHLFFMIWNKAIKNYSYYGSIAGQSEVNVTRFNKDNNQNWILSGNIKGKFSLYNSPNEIIEINDGRFDINLNTIRYQPFP